MVPQGQRPAGAAARLRLAADRVRGTASAIQKPFSITQYYGQVIWAMPLTVVASPLLADAVAPTVTVPDMPETHCTVAVPEPLFTMVAITWLVALLETVNWLEYGVVDGTGAGEGCRLNVPLVVKTTCPLEKF